MFAPYGDGSFRHTYRRLLSVASGYGHSPYGDG